MKVIVGEYITTQYSNWKDGYKTTNIIESAVYQKCSFDVKGLMPHIGAIIPSRIKSDCKIGIGEVEYELL